VVNQQPGASRAVAFPSDRVRSLFPALNQKPAFIMFDNVDVAEIPQVVFDAIHRHLLHRNVQRGGRYTKSMEMDDAIARARDSVGARINARNRNEIAFGMNATSEIWACAPVVVQFRRFWEALCSSSCSNH
jgi:selenocysteine lyase/cysteine desulfurase